MFSETSFHHGTITRVKADLILTAAKDDGSFLVRKSETVPGAHVLCLLYQGRVHKYQILTNADGMLYIQVSTSFLNSVNSFSLSQIRFVDVQIHIVCVTL